MPEEHYGFRAAPGTRSVAETLAHIVLVARSEEQMHFIEKPGTLAAFDFPGFLERMAGDCEAWRKGRLPRAG